MFLTTCVLKRVHQASMAIVLANRGGGSLTQESEGPMGSPALVAFVVGDARTCAKTRASQDAQQGPDFQPRARRATIHVRDGGVNALSSQDGGDSETVNTLVADIDALAGGPPQKKRRGRRVSKALRGLAHGLLLRKRSSDEKKEAVRAMADTIYQFDR